MMTAINYGIIAVILISSLLGWWCGDSMCFVISADLTSMTEQTAWQESSLIPSFQSLVLLLREQIQPEKATL
jgi:uncharacterized membrane protein required for colicin V production